ncbi:MAG: hypothetical protein JPMHGGIA_01075 [Saprospiraceae bacterium]|jgi:hypothetical protein|nr:hypothetical protein [Saprospiraceae bacterium]MBV6472814.1 hypothetical protein [Saprospiraceae bacterium]
MVLPLAAAAPLSDTSLGPVPKYSQAEWKKEKEDIAKFDKQLKEWKKAVKKANPDYLNTVYGRILEAAYREHNQLSNRVSGRSRQLIRQEGKSERDSLAPKAYNPELRDQPARVTKEEIRLRKAESDYLANYVDLVKKQTTLLKNLKNNKPFSSDAEPRIYADLTKELEAFRDAMKEELALMKKEVHKR